MVVVSGLVLSFVSLDDLKTLDVWSLTRFLNICGSTLGDFHTAYLALYRAKSFKAKKTESAKTDADSGAMQT